MMVTVVDWNGIAFIRQMITPQFACNPTNSVRNLHYSNNMLHTQAGPGPANGQLVLLVRMLPLRVTLA